MGSLRRRSNTKRSAEIRFQSLGLFAVATLLTLGLGGCAGRGSVQDNPSAHQKYVFASAYSSEDCQTKMNELAGTDVRVIEDDDHLVMSIFSFGIVPSHRCIGVARDASNSPPVSLK